MFQVPPVNIVWRLSAVYPNVAGSSAYLHMMASIGRLPRAVWAWARLSGIVTETAATVATAPSAATSRRVRDRPTVGEGRLVERMIVPRFDVALIAP